MSDKNEAVAWKPACDTSFGYVCELDGQYWGVLTNGVPRFTWGFGPLSNAQISNIFRGPTITLLPPGAEDESHLLHTEYKKLLQAKWRQVRVIKTATVQLES